MIIVAQLQSTTNEVYAVQPDNSHTELLFKAFSSYSTK